MKSRSPRKTLTVTFSALVFLGIIFGVTVAIRSPMFFVRVVEIGDPPENSPVDAQTIRDLAAVPVGKISLFDLNLNAIEKRILVHPWIREVSLQKRFPQTLSISVVFREPRALLQDKGGNLSYVDGDGKVFGQVNVLGHSDLPLLSGIASTDLDHINQGLFLIDAWERSALSTVSQLSTVSWESERGYRAWIAYSTQRGPARASVDLGQDFDGRAVLARFSRLNGVLRYLTQHSIVVGQIWADSGKKIVVRAAHGS